MGNLSNVSVIVVGAGFGGLTAAIELRRKGASVVVFEATAVLTEQGSLPPATIQTHSNQIEYRRHCSDPFECHKSIE